MTKTRTAMMTGDESGLPPRDKGAVRRFIRDYVDARRNLAEFMLPVMLIVLALSFLRTSAILLFVSPSSPTASSSPPSATPSSCGAACGPGSPRSSARRPRRTRGNGMYAAMRAFQLRRSRMPRVQVKRGEFPS